jgi:hypothetical protein
MISNPLKTRNHSVPLAGNAHSHPPNRAALLVFPELMQRHQDVQALRFAEYATIRERSLLRHLSNPVIFPPLLRQEAFKPAHHHPLASHSSTHNNPYASLLTVP